MGGPPRQQRLLQIVEARARHAGRDDAAVVVLGPRRCALYAALGLPHRDWWPVTRWADRAATGQGRAALEAYAEVLVADRCRLPGNDVVSDLIAYEADGDALTADEIRDIVAGLLAGDGPPALDQPV